MFDVIAAPFEALGLRAERARAVAAARGRVLEIGAGTGANLAHYPPAVDSIVACEADDGLRRRLAARAAHAPVPVTVAAAWPSGPASFDTVVSTLALCRVADLRSAAADLRSLMAPAGQLLFVEPVLAHTAAGRIQRAAAPLWARATSGWHLDRDVVAALRAAGFVVTDCERPELMGRLSAQTMVRGRAVPQRRP